MGKVYVSVAVLETADIGLAVGDRYVTCGHVIHWLEDDYDPKCNDTYCLISLDERYMSSGLARMCPEVDYSEFSHHFSDLASAVAHSNKKNISLNDFISSQDGYFHMRSSGESELALHDGDECDCGTYVEAVLEDLEREFGIPIGTHACDVMEGFVHSDFPELIGQLPVEYVPVDKDDLQ